ncbi:hypothetical protein B0T17DRAFT_511711 [Bombardia bombarda]|uniref:Uncharacterized protein n=1 Tax=Bombardia bombarda TaxID=252184 RepID=A0AA39TU30_9PEZI|nr:hypothetical protein B0T17DRAFT_511711 [Bombardia bombarda]
MDNLSNLQPPSITIVVMREESPPRLQQRPDTPRPWRLRRGPSPLPHVVQHELADDEIHRQHVDEVLDDQELDDQEESFHRSLPLFLYSLNRPESAPPVLDNPPGQLRNPPGQFLAPSLPLGYPDSYSRLVWSPTFRPEYPSPTSYSEGLRDCFASGSGSLDHFEMGRVLPLDNARSRASARRRGIRSSKSWHSSDNEEIELMSRSSHRTSSAGSDSNFSSDSSDIFRLESDDDSDGDNYHDSFWDRQDNDGDAGDKDDNNSQSKGEEELGYPRGSKFDCAYESRPEDGAEVPELASLCSSQSSENCNQDCECWGFYPLATTQPRKRYRERPQNGPIRGTSPLRPQAAEFIPSSHMPLLSYRPVPCFPYGYLPAAAQYDHVDPQKHAPNTEDVTDSSGQLKKSGSLPLPPPKVVTKLYDDSETFSGESSLSIVNPIWSYSFWKWKHRHHLAREAAVTGGGAMQSRQADAEGRPTGKDPGLTRFLSDWSADKDDSLF